MTEVKTRPSLIKVWLQISKRQATRCSFSIFARSAARGKPARAGADPRMVRIGTGPPFWQINHANSVYFRLFLGHFRGYISHPAPPFGSRPLLFTYPGSGLGVYERKRRSVISATVNQWNWCKLSSLFMIEPSSQSFIFYYYFILCEIWYIKKKKNTSICSWLFIIIGL